MIEQKIRLAAAAFVLGGMFAARSTSRNHMAQPQVGVSLPIYVQGRPIDPFDACGVHARVVRDYGVRMESDSIQRYRVLAGPHRCIRDAYVGFTDANRVDTYSIALEAVNRLSSRPFILYLVRCNAPAGWMTRFSRLVYVHMDVLPTHIWFAKIVAIATAPLLHGVIVESDSIITAHASELFRIAHDFCGPYPLLSLHPDPRPPQCTREAVHSCNPYHVAMHVRTTPYLHAHAVWGIRAREFASSILQVCFHHNSSQFTGHQPSIDCRSDEEALNTAIWNARHRSYLCMFDPYFSALGVQAWSGKREPSSVTDPTTAYFILHGAKSTVELEQVLEIATRGPTHLAVWHDKHFQPSAWRVCTEHIDPADLCA